MDICKHYNEISVYLTVFRFSLLNIITVYIPHFKHVLDNFNAILFLIHY